MLWLEFSYKMGSHKMEKRIVSFLVHEVNEREKKYFLFACGTVDLKHKVHSKVMLLSTIYMAQFTSAVVVLRSLFSYIMVAQPTDDIASPYVR